MDHDAIDDGDDIPRPNRDDTTARDRLQVALMLMTSSRPPTEREVGEVLLGTAPGSANTSRMRLERCREALVEAGLPVERTGNRGEEVWHLDEHRLWADDQAVSVLDKADEGGVSPADILRSMLCTWAAGDGAPMAEELHRAAAKISHSFSAQGQGSQGPGGHTARDVSRTLRAIARSHPIEVTYLRRNGDPYEGRLLPYRRLSCWGRGYLLAARPERPDEPHLYRDDRFSRLTVVEDETFEPPAPEVLQGVDISLPFQIPPAEDPCDLEVRVWVPRERYLVVREETLGHGRWEQEDDRWYWTIGARDLDGVVTWLVDRGLEAVAPDEVVSRTRERIEAAREAFRR